MDLDDFIAKNGDPFVSQLPGMESPVYFLLLGVNLVLFCKVWGPIYMRNRKAVDLRPAYIILNGLAFGAYFLGLLAGVFLSNWLTDCFNCSSYVRDTNDLKHISMKYLGYCMIWTKVFDFSIPVMSVFAKNDHKVTAFQVTHLFGALMLCWAGAILNPGGIFILIALNDTVYQALVYGYMVMMAASAELHPDRNFRWTLFTFRVVSIIFCFLHQLYFLSVDNCSTYELRLFTTIYAGLVGIFYPIDIYQRLKTEEKMSSRSKFTDENDNQAGRRLVKFD